MAKVETLVQLRTKAYRSSITRPADTTAYAAGDAVSAATDDEHFTFGALNDDNSDVPGRPGILSGVLNGIRLYSSANVATKLEGLLYIFSTDITATADNAAFAPSDTEMLTLEAVVTISSANWVAGTATAGAAGNAVALVRNFDMPLKTNRTGQLFAQLVATNAYAPVSGEVFTCDLLWTQN